MVTDKAQDTEKPPRHLGLKTQCGICADRILPREWVVALLGNDDSTEYKNRTRRFPFPQPGERKTYVGGSCLCQNPDCRVCAALPECLSVHYNCLVVFTSSCSSQAHNDATEDVMRRLWVLAASKTPWRGALPVFLPSASLPGAGGDSLRTAAALAKMPQLCTLPAELIRDIREYSPHALLWRCAAALELVRHVKDTVAAPLRVLRMADILFWTRGSEPEPVSPGVAPPPVIRLTIDSNGISMVERLHTRPVYSAGHRDSLAFIVTDDDLLGICFAFFQDGILRLRLRGKAAEYPPTIWNTPAPPVGPPSHCTYMSKPPPSWHRCFVAEAESICGITFFFSDFAVSAIHTHSAHSTDISATATAEYFSHRSKGAVAWLYVPIAKNDQLLALGFRRARLGVHILVRLKLAGDVVFGRSGIVPIGEAERDKVDIDDDDNDENKLWYSEYVFNEYDTSYEDLSFWASPAPLTLVHGEPKPFSRRCLFELFCRQNSLEESSSAGSSSSSIPSPLRLWSVSPGAGSELVTPPMFMGPDAYYSCAPLDGVVSALVFLSDDADDNQGERPCQGLLFRYANGGSRAVGECRVGAGAFVEVQHPTILSYRLGGKDTRDSRLVAHKKVYVKFLKGVNDEQHRPYHKLECCRDHVRFCRPLKGNIIFMFTTFSAFVDFDCED